MRQLTCTAPGKLEWLDVPAPTLEADVEALVRPLAVARCDIDLFLTSGLFNAPDPFAVGHECVGEIVALGDAVAGLALGDRVIVSFQLCCGECVSCKRGHTAVCERYPVLSDYGMQPLSKVEYGGMLSDLIRVPYAQAMLRKISADVDAASAGSLSDNVLDGYRAVAPHLAAQPGADVLVVAHGLPSIPLYAAQAAIALGARRVDFASNDEAALALAASLGANPVRTDFSRASARYPIVVDAGVFALGLQYSIRSTQREGVCQSVSFVPGREVPVPLSKMYTEGIRFFIGRCHAAALLPEVVPRVESGQLKPGRITTRVVDWEDAPQAWLDPSIKLVVTRA